MGRDEALKRSLVSTHVILNVRGGKFISLLDPPESFREMAESCRNIGTYPVLVGAEGERDTMLASPIILYDYPQIAPESDGDLFDGTEINELLALRILTLTDEEKREMRDESDSIAS
jgi:hydrogenase maturation protease